MVDEDEAIMKRVEFLISDVPTTRVLFTRLKGNIKKKVGIENFFTRLKESWHPELKQKSTNIPQVQRTHRYFLSRIRLLNIFFSFII